MTTTPQADCFTHDTWHKGPHGAPADDLTGVILAPFDPAWDQDHWESITIVGPNGSTTVTHPAAGFHPAPGGELLSWIACKGYDHPQETTTTTIAVPVTTTTVAGASTTTTSTLPPASVPSSTIPPAIDLDITACTEQPESCLGTTIAVPVDSTLPATGRGDSALGLGGGVLLLAGATMALIARRRNHVRPTVSEPKSNVMQVRRSAGPFDWTTEK